MFKNFVTSSSRNPHTAGYISGETYYHILTRNISRLREAVGSEDLVVSPGSSYIIGSRRVGVNHTDLAAALRGDGGYSAGYRSGYLTT